MATLFVVYLKTLGPHNVTQELQLRLHETAFGQLCIQLMLPEHLKHNFDVLHMLLSVLAVNDYVVQVHQDKLANELLQHIIHDSLEGAWGIGQTKAQYCVLIKTPWRCERRLGHILRLEPDLVVCTLQVHSTEHLCSL